MQRNESLGPDGSLGRFAVAALVISTLLVVLVTVSSLGAVPDGLRQQIGQLFPEGWVLFAEPPQAPRFRAAISTAGRWRDATRLPLGKPSNAFGLSRSVRWQSLEIRWLVAAVPKLDSWTECRGRPLRCLAEAERRDGARRVRNRTTYRTLCGRVGLVRQVIEPPGSRGAGPPLRTTHVVALDARC